MQHAASAITAPDTGQLPAYWQFHEAVTRAQLTEWLPTGRHLLVDVSGPRGPAPNWPPRPAHTVLRVLDPGPGRAGGGSGGGAAPRSRAVGGVGPAGAQIVPVIADSSRLTFLGDGCADGVIADDRALSVYLAAEAMIAEIARVLRPAGRVIACVDSLVLGMAVLADQHHWAHLVDLPHAEVVLVPWPDGRITRCLRPGPGPRAVHRGRAPGQLDPVADRVLRVGGDALAAPRPRRPAQAGAGRTRGPVRRVARRAAGYLGQQAALAARGDGGGQPPQSGGLGDRPPPSYRWRLAHLDWQPTQRAASGRASSLPSGICVTAVHALSVAGLVDAGQRGEHPVTLVAGGQEDRLGAVGLGENGPRVARIRRIPRARHGPGAARPAGRRSSGPGRRASPPGACGR